MEANNLLSFWFALMLFLLMQILGFVLEQFTRIWYPYIFVLFLGGYYRGKLKQVQGITSNYGALDDLILWLCCSCCSIIQEAKHTELASIRKLNMEAQNQAQAGQAVIVNTAP